MSKGRLLSIESSKDLPLGMRYFLDGVVVSNEDPFESREIKVRIADIDKNIDRNEDLPPCYPAMSPYFHFVPQVGEKVKVILDVLNNGNITTNQGKRYYISTNISQPQNIDFDPYYYTANSNESDGWTRRDTPISQIPTARGTYPRKDEISLVGRDNTDITLRKREILLRVGRHERDNYLTFNRKNPSFIQLRYGLNNAGAEKKTRTITKLEQIPPDHSISVSIDAKNRLLMKVILKSSNSVIEQFSASYSTKELVVTVAKSTIRDYQIKYPKWELRTIDDDLQSLPIIYPNNTRIVKQEAEFNENNEFKETAGSCINIVSEKINIISHKSANNFNLTDPDKQIDEQTQLEINSTLHPMVYGDNLIEFMNLVKDFVKSHTHAYAGLPTVQDETTKKLLNFNLENLVDKNIRLG